MHTTATIAFGMAALAALAQAIPTESSKADLYVRSTSADVTCGNGQVISCCDTSTTTIGSDNTAGGLLGLGDLLDGVLGGACSPLGVGGEFFAVSPFSPSKPLKSEFSC
jgi:hypothetical protein